MDMGSRVGCGWLHWHSRYALQQSQMAAIRAVLSIVSVGVNRLYILRIEQQRVGFMAL